MLRIFQESSDLCCWPRYTKCPRKESRLRQNFSEVRLHMASGSAEALSAKLHHEIKISLVGPSGCAIRPH